MRSWVDVFGARIRPEGLIWRTDDGEPVGCALLSFVRGRIGPFRVRRAFVNATGEHAVASEHNDVLVISAHRNAVTSDLVRRVLARGTDELCLAGFKSDAAKEVAAEWPSEDGASGESEDPWVDLDALRGAGTPYLGALSGNTRSQIRRSLKLYTKKHGAPTVEIAASAEVAGSWLEELTELHSSRWRARGLPGAFGTHEQRRFHQQVVAQGRDAGADLAADILRVRFGSVTVGLLYLLRRDRCVGFYQSGLVYETDNRLKPGLVVHALAVEHYLTAGAAEYDFLAGEAEATQYKRSLSTLSRTLCWVDLGAPTARMALIGALRGLKRRVGETRRRLRRTK